MKIAAIRSHRLYKPIMLGIALLIFIIALVNSYYLNYYIDRNSATTPSAASEAVTRRVKVTKFFKEPTELTDNDFATISGLINLQKLSLIETQISDLELLRELTSLQQLSISNTRVSNLEPIRGLINLRSLLMQRCDNISDAQVEDLKKALPNLSILRGILI